MSDQDQPGAVATLDLRGVACPLTFVKTRMALDRLAPGEPLEVLLDVGEPADSVPAACTEDGDLVLELTPWSEPGVVRLVVARSG
ncbi:MAG TPA: sulfurtransferase TusA family protein [Candidatus Saccharimonadales bacterium]|nr:sulfurtransferase TusA family protein [Candidatus Saccharimonadales bacterium]